ncbi:hypothetical protein, partial [Arthrobacter sp. GCM10027362]|uniref:hypothetical protein n=1 Tax=Arthrobacter sp. GCM10027362 TaxID=3273379 RepID=UPI00366FD6ED
MALTFIQVTRRMLLSSSRISGQARRIISIWPDAAGTGAAACRAASWGAGCGDGWGDAWGAGCCGDGWGAGCWGAGCGDAWGAGGRTAVAGPHTGRSGSIGAGGAAPQPPPQSAALPVNPSSAAA